MKHTIFDANTGRGLGWAIGTIPTIIPDGQLLVEHADVDITKYYHDLANTIRPIDEEMQIEIQNEINKLTEDSKIKQVVEEYNTQQARKELGLDYKEIDLQTITTIVDYKKVKETK